MPRLSSHRSAEGRAPRPRVRCPALCPSPPADLLLPPSPSHFALLFARAVGPSFSSPFPFAAPASLSSFTPLPPSDARARAHTGPMSFVPPPNTAYQTYADPSNPYGGTDGRAASPQQQGYAGGGGQAGSTASSDHFYQQQQQAGAAGYDQPPAGGPGGAFGNAGGLPSRASTPTFTDSQHGGNGGGGAGGGFRPSEPYVRSFAVFALLRRRGLKTGAAGS